MTLRNRVDKQLAEYYFFARQATAEGKALETARQAVCIAEEGQRVVQEVAQAVQQEVHKQIAGVVTRCLQAVYGEKAPEFHILFEKKRGRTEAKIVFRKNGNDTLPKECDSGGMIDVAAFALRVACVLLHRPAIRRLLILDEPFKGVHADRLPLIAELMETLATEMNFQFILTTQTKLRVGKVISLD